MSRFYRTLQEAGRSGLDSSEAVEESAPTVALASQIHAISEERARVTPAAEAQNGSLGIPMPMALDKAIPLIPNAVDGSVIEHYRRLRAKIIQEQERKPFRSLVVTSPAPGDGKSVTALNLALSFGMLPSYRVLLVDGDLRKGRLGEMLGLHDPPGLNNLIEGSAELKDVVLKCEELPFYFIARGRAATPPAELLHSSRLVPQFQKMKEHFSLVLVDSAPVNLVADAQLLAVGCDAVLLVARAFATSRKELERAVQDLSAVRVIGTVLNRGMRADLYRHYKNYK